MDQPTQELHLCTAAILHALSRALLSARSGSHGATAYLFRSGLSSVMFVGWVRRSVVGGAWARWRDRVCPRTPRLTSVLDSGWLPVVGDMMCDGVFRQMVLRPLILSGPFPVGGRQQSAGSWPRFIG
jgi:hypothetical protein